MNLSDISNAIFSHIDSKHKMSIDKITLMINQYDSQKRENENDETAREYEYQEQYENKRQILNQLYDTFLIERNEIYKKWMVDKSKDTLHRLIDTKFDKFELIPDIYVRADKKIKTQKDLSKVNKISDFKVTSKIDKVPKVKTLPKTKVLKKPEGKKQALQCGISNLGNSCYINSSLQYLIHLPIFNQILNQNKGKENIVLEDYISLYEAYVSKNVSNSNITNIVQNLNNNLIDADKFDVKAQNDASDFLNKFLEKLNINEINKLFEVNIETQKEFHKTITKGKKELKCEEKKPVSNTLENSVILKFEDKTKIYNIGSELSKAYDGIVEEISKKSEYLNCDRVVDVINNKQQSKLDKFPFTRTDKITSFPDILRVSLTIFDSKLNKNFIKLEIPNEWNYKNYTYKLNGIVAHIGTSLTSGHYKYFSLEDDKWYEYSDSEVIEHKPMKSKTHYYKLSSTEDNVFISNKSIPCPYILSYVKTTKNM